MAVVRSMMEPRGGQGLTERNPKALVKVDQPSKVQLLPNWATDSSKTIPQSLES